METSDGNGVREERRPKVLVVDDEEWMRDACVEILQAEGYEVQAAVDGPTGLELIRRSSPDLVLVDLKMPGMDGIAYLGSVKGFDPEIVAIMITGYATLESAVEAMKKGAYDFLPKPFKPAELRAVARRGIRHPLLPGIEVAHDGPYARCPVEKKVRPTSQGLYPHKQGKLYVVPL